MPRASLDDIQTFTAVVDAGTFAAGGKSLGLSRSAAGKAVSRLEDRLGVRLLNRTTRALSLTEEGRDLYNRGLQILASVDAAEDSVTGRNAAPRGVLRITVPDAFGRIVLLPVVIKYMSTWPDVQVELSLTDRLANIVEEGYDLAIRIGVTSPDSGLISRVVAGFTAVVCASPSYLVARGEPMKPDDLASHDCLLFTSRNARQNWRFQGDDGSWIKAQGRSRLRLDNADAIRDATIAGLGIAFLPDFLVAADLQAGRLRQVLHAHVASHVKIVALFPDKRLMQPRVRRFVELMVQELG